MHLYFHYLVLVLSLVRLRFRPSVLNSPEVKGVAVMLESLIAHRFENFFARWIARAGNISGHVSNDGRAVPFDSVSFGFRRCRFDSPHGRLFIRSLRDRGEARVTRFKRLAQINEAGSCLLYFINQAACTRIKFGPDSVLTKAHQIGRPFTA